MSLRNLVEATTMFGGACLLIGGTVYAVLGIVNGFPSSMLQIAIGVATYAGFTFVALFAFGIIVYVSNVAGIRDTIEAAR